MGYQEVFEALGDETRRRVFEQLRRGPVAVGEIARVLPVSRPAVSKHLRVLADAGLVRYQSAGTRNLYQVDPRGLVEVRTWLDGFWDEALRRFAEQVQRDRRTRRPGRRRQ
ncbi:MAG TPA: metalloregulator ArsR/SmtB family transcription factor [Candidatus Dormibacteraeota bacterium]|nr:metalloregulator ArsR/SmtB family transcription factor [Candidatus Dormibacteraeota bacterium]